MSRTDEIAGVVYEPRRVIEDARGSVLHFLRADAPNFTTFGEVYFSEARPGAVKGWKRHHRQTQRYVVPVGRLRVVLYDDRERSPSRGVNAVWTLGRPDDYGLLTVPPLIWYAFAAHGDATALLANCADLPHDPNEAENLPIDGGGNPALARCYRLFAS